MPTGEKKAEQIFTPLEDFEHQTDGAPIVCNKSMDQLPLSWEERDSAVQNTLKYTAYVTHNI